jgi:hypothetical protein
MISSAVLRQTNGFGSSFQCSARSSIGSTSAATLENASRRSRLSVSRLNQPSAIFNQELEVGVEWRCQQARSGWASQLVTPGSPVGLEAVEHSWTSSSRGTLRSISLKKVLRGVQVQSDDVDELLLAVGSFEILKISIFQGLISWLSRIRARPVLADADAASANGARRPLGRAVVGDLVQGVADDRFDGPVSSDTH